MLEQITPMTDEDLVKACKDEISRGIGGNVSSDTDTDISRPLDYYFGRAPSLSKVKAKDKNASRFVSQDVMDGVESTVAEIMPSFVTDEIGFYEPEDERDEDSSRAETDIVNYLFMEEYDGYTLLQSAIKDALLHRNCTVKTYWDERVEVEYETHDDVPEFGLAQILAPTSDDQTVEVVEQYVSEEADPEAQELLDIAQRSEQVAQQALANPQMAQQVAEMAQDKYSIKIKRTTRVGKPMLKGLPPEQVIVCGDHDSPMLHNARFVAHELVETKSSLIAQGFDPEIIDKLSEYSTNIDNHSRTRNVNENDFNSSHESTKLIRVFECYPLIDFDGDGIAERRKVVISENHLLSNEEWSNVSMVGGATTTVPHKYKGISMYDRLKDIQDAKTPIMRSIIDGTQLSSNPRLGVVTGQANLDDILTSRTGGVVRAETANSIFEVPNPQVPQSSYSMLEFMDGVRRDRGGGAIDSSAQAMAVSGDTAHGIERVMSQMEMTNAMLARTIGETLVRGIFIELHNLIRENHKGMLSAKIGGKWVTTMPTEWKKRTNVSIQVGSSHAERARQSNFLRGVIGIQKELAMTQSPMYSEQKSYSAITDAVRLGGIKSPDRYFVDPSSPEGQQASAGKSKQQQEMQAKEEYVQQELIKAQKIMADAEMVKGQADMQTNAVKAQNEGLKNQITALKNEMEAMGKAGDLKFKYDELEEQTALALTELEVQARKDLSTINKDNKSGAGNE